MATTNTFAILADIDEPITNCKEDSKCTEHRSAVVALPSIRSQAARAQESVPETQPNVTVERARSSFPS